MVMEIACHMFQHKPEKKDMGTSPNDTHGYFKCARSKLLGNPNGFLKDMVEYDKEHIPEKTVKLVNAVFKRPEFSFDAVKAAFEALFGICKWANAMMTYHELLKIVNPKREKVAEMNVMLKEVRARLKEKMDALREVEERMEKLEATYQEKLAEEAALVAKIEDCNKKLERASKIMDGLAGEKSRW
jgi:dynein heavy chain